MVAVYCDLSFYNKLVIFQGKMGMPGFPGINGIPVSTTLCLIIINIVNI